MKDEEGIKKRGVGSPHVWSCNVPYFWKGLEGDYVCLFVAVSETGVSVFEQ